MRRIVWLTFGFALSASAVAACRPQGRSRAGPAAVDAPASTTFRFPHAAPAHAGMLCIVCHAEADVEAGRPARPGTQDHAPCDRGECHAAAFQTRPGRLCTLCHARVVPTEAGATTPAPWPPREGPRALAAEFSHARHLDKAALDAQVGFHVACDDCHDRAAEVADPPLPDHRACARCHGGARSVPPRMGSCDGCHRARDHVPPRGRRLGRGAIRFRHDRHEHDRKGDVSCVTCHTDVPAQKTTVATSVPATAVCVECHEDEERAPPSVRMARCEVCHGEEGFGLATLTPPRSHLPPQARPEDHTLAFRRDHAGPAQREAPRCARCHSMMSGTRHHNCDQCHQSMRPRDHVITWREFDHGPASAADAERCALCHVGEFCTACHRRPPRNHFPLITFRARDHALAARFDARACLVCHDVEKECVECHR